MAELKVLTNLKMKTSDINLHMYDEVPENPSLGNISLIEGVTHIYTSIAGGDPFWMPLGIKRTIAQHVQVDAATEWTVNHNLGTVDMIIGVYDDDSQLMHPSSMEFVNNDQVKLNFTEAVAGKAIIFGNSELWAATV